VVSAGQVLAEIDPGPLELALQQAQASLASAQAQLDNTKSGTALQQSIDQLNQANQAYTDAVNAANQTTANDQSQLSSDQATLNSDTAILNNDKSAYWFTQYAAALATYQGDLSTAQLAWQNNLPPCSYSVPATGSCLTDQNAIQAAQNNIACTQGTSMVGCTFQQQQMAAAFKAELAAQGQVNADTSKVSADNSKLSSDQAAGQRSIQQAQNSVTNAQDSYNSQAVNRPATIAQQAASAASLAAQVDTAQTNLDADTLVSPIAGVVTSVSAQAGDAVSAGGSSTGSQAPGTTALLPSSGNGSASSAGGFITVMANSSYVTVVSMAESDAAKVQAGQTGSTTFDAISGLTIPVHVLAVAGSATITSNVVNYYVTLALDGTDTRLRAGLTTNASVITASATNVLVLQNSAISHRGTLAFVTLLQGGKSVLTPVTLGVVGATTTEILTGLKAGDKVVLPTASTGAATTRTGGGGGGLFRGAGG